MNLSSQKNSNNHNQNLNQPKQSKKTHSITKSNPTNLSNSKIKLNSANLNVENINSKQKRQSSIQIYQTRQIGQQYSSMKLDYQNGKYQGKLSSLVNEKSTRIIKQGSGIIMDDELNFIVSNWKNNTLNGKTALINKFGNYIYGRWNQDLLNPIGIVTLRIGSLVILTKFNQKTAKWNMISNYQSIKDKNNQKINNQKINQYKQKNQYKQTNNTFIVIDEQNYSLLVLKGNIEEISNQFKSSKTYPLTVVQFAHFPPDQIQQNKIKNKSLTKQKTNTKNVSKSSKRNLQQILYFYANKYGFKTQNYQHSLSQYLQSITEDTKKSCINTKQFAANVSKSLLNQLFSQRDNDKKPNKQNYQTYESQKQKLYDQNSLVFKQCKQSQIKKTKQHCVYFGYLNGLGIKFIHQSEESIKNKESPTNNNHKQKYFILKSMGNHNSLMKLQDIGAKFYPNKCIQQGNFKTKSTCTYQNALFRPSNKLISIYNKYHKQQVSVLNQYFDKNQLSAYKLLSQFENFIDEHIIYIMNQCFIQTTKFHQKDQKNQLISKLLAHPTNLKNKDNHKQSSFYQYKYKASGYEVHIQRKNKNKNQKVCTVAKEQSINALKNKNNELKQKIKKVKYQIQYLPPDDQNIIIMKDDKFISKIKKHLYSENMQLSNIQNKITHNKTTNKALNNKNKSTINSRSKSRKSYIERQKKRVVSPSQKQNTILGNRQNKRNSSLLNNDSLQKIDNYLIKRINTSGNGVKQKASGQRLLQRINDSIEFKSRYNNGIEYNIENENIREWRRQQQSNKRRSNKKSKRNKRIQSNVDNKNIYNGRDRFFTDYQLDHFISNSILSASSISVMEHYIYSNTNRNMNNEQQRYQNQKDTQDRIRAQMLGIRLQEYRNKIEYQQQKESYMQNEFMRIIRQQQLCEKIKRRQINSMNYINDINETFGIDNEYSRQKQQKCKVSSNNKYNQQTNNNIKNNNLSINNNSYININNINNKSPINSSRTNKNINKNYQNNKNKSFYYNHQQPYKLQKQKQQKQQKQKQKLFKQNQRLHQLQQILYCPKPKQQSLVQKRMRILKSYKQLNNQNYHSLSSNPHLITNTINTNNMNINHNNNNTSYNHISTLNTNFNNLNTNFNNHNIGYPLSSISIKNQQITNYKKQKHISRLPIYKQKVGCRIKSPLRSILQSRQNNEQLLGYGRQNYIKLQQFSPNISYQNNSNLSYQKSMNKNEQKSRNKNYQKSVNKKEKVLVSKDEQRSISKGDRVKRYNDGYSINNVGDRVDENKMRRQRNRQNNNKDINNSNINSKQQIVNNSNIVNKLNIINKSNNQNNQNKNESCNNRKYLYYFN